jgi:hypothetical protein
MITKNSLKTLLRINLKLVLYCFRIGIWFPHTMLLRAEGNQWKKTSWNNIMTKDLWKPNHLGRSRRDCLSNDRGEKTYPTSYWRVRIRIQKPSADLPAAMITMVDKKEWSSKPETADRWIRNHQGHDFPYIVPQIQPQTNNLFFFNSPFSIALRQALPPS